MFVFVSVLIRESITGASSASILALLPFLTPACFARASVTPCLLSPNIFPIILSPSSRSALSSCSAAERPLLCCPSASYSDSAPTFVPALSDMACTSSGMALPMRFSACFSFTFAAFATCFTELPDISSPASILMMLPILLSPSVAVLMDSVYMYICLTGTIHCNYILNPPSLKALFAMISHFSVHKKEPAGSFCLT